MPTGTPRGSVCYLTLPMFEKKRKKVTCSGAVQLDNDLQPVLLDHPSVKAASDGIVAQYSG